MIPPSEFHQHSAYELLQEAGQGRIGFDRRLLHALLDNPEKTIPDLVKFGLENHEHHPVPLDDDLLDLFRYLQSPKAIPFLVEYIRREPETVPDTLLDALYPIRQEAVEPLLELFENLEEDQAGEVAFLLASFRIYDPRILKLLLDRMEYDAGDGALCLGLYGDPAARPDLEKLLASLTEDEAHLKQDVVDAIQQLGRPMDEGAAAPYDIWSDYPEKTGPAVSVLTEAELRELIDSRDNEYRLAGVAGWVNRDYDGPIRKSLLRVARQDEDVDIRAKAWHALGSEIDRAEIRAEMLAKLQDANAADRERAGALLGLAHDAGQEPIRSYAIEFYRNPKTRLQSMEAMRNSFDRSFAPYFPDHLDDSDTEIKREAIFGVGYLGITEHADRLKEYFDDDDFRSDALFAFALSVKADVSPSRIRSLYGRIGDMAGGLDDEEDEIVQLALDERLMLNGHEPVFFRTEEEASEGPRVVAKVGRNDPCPCGSGKKYKKCCGAN